MARARARELGHTAPIWRGCRASSVMKAQSGWVRYGSRAEARLVSRLGMSTNEFAALYHCANRSAHYFS
jgi:hypothetical protein